MKSTKKLLFLTTFFLIGCTCGCAPQGSNSGESETESNRDSYTISYNLDGGTNSPNNPSTYNLESSFTFEDPTKTGYTFLGWFDTSDKQVTGISIGSSGELTITAKWSANLNTLIVASEDVLKGTVEIKSGSGYSDESISIIATPLGDCVFRGWYYQSLKVSGDEIYTFKMPTNDYSLVARFFTKIELEEYEERYATKPILSTNGKTVKYGLYPNRIVDDELLISQLQTLTPDINGWYLYDDVYYAKTIADPVNEAKKFSNGKYVKIGQEYWFKCQPIEWNVLSKNGNEYFLHASVILDVSRWCKAREIREIDGKTIYPNNYKYSDIRAWLNNDFYNTAFALGSSNIKTTIVDNSASTLNPGSGQYACENTEDKVFLPSYNDFQNKSYFEYFGYCLRDVTDWSTATGVGYQLDNSNRRNHRGDYWSRSPDFEDSLPSDHRDFYRASLIDWTGELRNCYVQAQSSGACPSITITID